ncbi:Sensor histidine kinase CssS [compost metagenome]
MAIGYGRKGASNKMKMVHQINLAFGMLIVLVIAVTAAMNHYVLLDHFIGTQKEDMQTIGKNMTAELKQSVSYDTITMGTTAAIATLSPIVPNVEAIITNTEGEIVYGTIPSIAMRGMPAYTQTSMVDVTPLTSIQRLTEGRDDRFVISATAIPQGTLTLFTPMSKIKAVEQALLGRLLIVLCVSGALVYLLSLLITSKLIKPLMKLRAELKKVEGRQFSEVRLVKAGGEIGAVAQTVYELAGELDRYNQVQKQFFQNASHELKTPLMSIAGYAEGIRDGIFEGEGARKGLDIILSESGRLKNIVMEMTLLAKLDSEEDIFRMGEVNMEELLTETKERVNPLLVKKGLSLHIRYDEKILGRWKIRADRDKLTQALLNVVSNATRYASREILIEVSVGKDQMNIAVSDDGAGIPQELLPYLFHRFVKGKDGDTGLGLAISRAIVERCKGHITAGNQDGGGAVISMGFPVLMK